MAIWRFAVGTLLGPTFVGKVYDLTGHYDGAFFAAGGIVLLAVPVFCLAAFCRRSIERPSPSRAADRSSSDAMKDSEKADHREQVVPACDASEESPHGKCKL